MTLIDTAPRTAPRIGPPVETVPVGDALWRVIRPGGELLGYIDRVPTGDGDRFRVRRMLATQRRFIGIGEFWRFEDALGCFRF